MAASAGGAKGGYQRRSSRRKSSFKAMSEINVTPMVDVMLVLLIIFMVAAPLMTVGVPVELPETKAKALQSPNEPITVSVQADGKVYLQEVEIAFDDLVPKLQAIGKQGTEEQVFVRADAGVNYGHVMKVMGALNAAGYKKLGLVTGSENTKKSAGLQ
jgi:biopolymer transport protein TolR